MPYKNDVSIGLRMSTKDALERYKKESWSWDRYLRILLKKAIKKNKNS